MNRYTLLIVLNAPFVVYGLLKAIGMFKKGRIGRLGIALRLVFWVAIGLALVLSRQGLAFLASYHLTDSATITLADVFLTTGIVFCMFLIIRVYAKADAVEARLDELHERLSILISTKK